MKTSNGFTLVEMLIATTLMVLLISSASFAHRIFTQQWSRLSERNHETLSDAIFLQKLSKSLGSTLSVVIQSKEGNDFGFMWLADRNGFYGLTDYSLFYPGRLSVYRVSFTNNTQGCLLQYEEGSGDLSSTSIDSFQSAVFSDSRSFMFQAQCQSFSYFGWPKKIESSSEDAFAPLALKDASWANVYNGLQYRSIPIYVKLQFDSSPSQALSFSLPYAVAGLRFGTQANE